MVPTNAYFTCDFHATIIESLYATKRCSSQEGVREISHSQSHNDCSRPAVDEDGLSGIQIERLVATFQCQKEVNI